MILIIILGSVYSITLTGLLIKLNKTACLHAIVKTNITKLPKWDFAFTYLPIVISAPIIIYIVWTLEDPVTMTWSVPSLFQISKIDDIYIQWYCEFNRYDILLHSILKNLPMTLVVSFHDKKKLNCVKQQNQSRAYTFELKATNISIFDFECKMFLCLNIFYV